MSTAPKQEPAKTRVVESVRYPFTADEIRLLGEALAREAQTVFTLREQKKESTASFGVLIAEANGRVAGLTHKINEGYEMRDTECRVLPDVPRRGMKSIMRLDTGEIVREEAMTAEEMQDAFKFEELPVEEGEDPESQPRKRGRPSKGNVN
jgi:hypothetical protein